MVSALTAHFFIEEGIVHDYVTGASESAPLLVNVMVRTEMCEYFYIVRVWYLRLSAIMRLKLPCHSHPCSNSYQPLHSS
jgi:hypothetical protein